MAFWKALIVLYRLIVVSRRIINLLPIISTREGVGIRISSPKSKSKSGFHQKEKEIDTLISTTAVNVDDVGVDPLGDFGLVLELRERARDDLRVR